MTMRSMPPASSHLAERPVPAPPPISGLPAASLARKRSSSVCLAMRGMGADGRRLSLGARRGLAPGGDQGIGEGLVVDVQRQADELPVGAGAKALLDRLEQRPVGVGIVEWLAGPIDRRHAAFG